MKRARPIVDMGIRPSFLHKLFGSAPDCPESETVCWFNQRVGDRDPDHFTQAAAHWLPARLHSRFVGLVLLGLLALRLQSGPATP